MTTFINERATNWLGWDVCSIVLHLERYTARPIDSSNDLRVDHASLEYLD